jgi:hypothetical protein
MDTGPLLNRRQVSEYLRDHYGLVYARSTLNTMGCRGTGPPFRVFRRKPLYAPTDIDAWVMTQLSDPHISTKQKLSAEVLPATA